MEQLKIMMEIVTTALLPVVCLAVIYCNVASCENTHLKKNLKVCKPICLLWGKVIHKNSNYSQYMAPLKTFTWYSDVADFAKLTNGINKFYRKFWVQKVLVKQNFGLKKFWG